MLRGSTRFSKASQCTQSDRRTSRLIFKVSIIMDIPLLYSVMFQTLGAYLTDNGFSGSSTGQIIVG